MDSFNFNFHFCSLFSFHSESLDSQWSTSAVTASWKHLSAVSIDEEVRRNQKSKEITFYWKLKPTLLSCSNNCCSLCSGKLKLLLMESDSRSARTCCRAIYTREQLLVGFNLLLRSIVAQSRLLGRTAFSIEAHESDVSEWWRWICFTILSS